MSLELKLSQKLSQSLVMTPQLQQAIKLLQLGRLEYAEMIEKELLENPVLEESVEDTEIPNEALSATDLLEKIQDGQIQISEAAQEVFDADKEGFSRNEELLDYYHTFADSFEGGFSGVVNNSETYPTIESTVSNQEGLASHLLWQLKVSNCSKDDLDVASHIIGNLDLNGYLGCSLEEIAETIQLPVDEVERVLKIVHTLDPIGIGARDLRECLLIQLEAEGDVETLTWKIVSEHLTRLELKKYDEIAKLEGVAIQDVIEAAKAILKLEPRPGRPFVDEAPIYVVPDVYVRKIENEYVVLLNEAGVPKLRLSSYYQELLVKGVDESLPEKEYLQERLRAATWLIRSIQQRQQTIYKVTKSIFKFQEEFLESGVSRLKPLVLRDVADDVGMHESTVSRVTTNKYVHTPQGVFELKFFFSSGIKSGAGEVSSESVKQRIKELIAKENPKKPLSDQAIVEMLKAEGVDIARRTVAKYREMMNLLSSSRRKSPY